MSTPFHKYLLVIWIIAIAFGLKAQSGDSILINETTLSRPLVVHQNQIRVSMAYNYSIFNVQFSGSERTRLFDEGRAGLGHGFRLKLKYGITENFQIGLNTAFLNTEIRTESLTILDEEFYDIYYVQQQQGWDDPVVSLTYRLPLPRALDILFVGEMNLPIASFGQIQPDHQITFNQEGDPDEGIPPYYTINYTNRQGNGHGEYFGGLGSTVKYRFNKKVAFSGGAFYSRPVSTYVDKEWFFTLEDNESFTYENRSFQVQEPDLLEYFISFEYQAFSSFNVYGQFLSYNRKNGWTNKPGFKQQIPEERFAAFQLGYEIVATPRIWISQFFQVAVAGENTYAPFIINTRVRYNLIL